MSKQNLIIVKNQHNDKGSELYHKAIRKNWKDSYQDDINLITYCIDDQKQLEEQLSHYRGKVLLLEPTNLYLPDYMKDRNAEQDQTAMYVSSEIKKRFDNYSNSILIIGKGRVGKKIFEELCLKSGYCCAIYGSDFEMNTELSKQFDIVINAVPQGVVTEEYVNCKALFDISGTFKEGSKIIWVQDGDDKRMAYIDSTVHDKYDIRKIGRNTVYRLLEDVKNS